MPSPEWAKPLIAVFDFAITTGTTDKLVEAKPLTDSPKTRILHDVGWSLGKVSFGSISDLNIDFTIAKAFRLRIEEIGIITDADGGKYFVLSASIGTPSEIANDPKQSLMPPPDSAGEANTTKTGFGLRIHRLKFRIGSGDELETRFKLDGLSLWIRGKRFELLGFGMVSEFDLEPPGNHYEEMGFELKMRLRRCRRNSSSASSFSMDA